MRHRMPRVAFVPVALLLAACATGGSPARTPEALPMRAMTFNIAAGNGDLARIAATIREAAPDVVALQEVDVRWNARSAFADQAAELARLLGMNVRFAPIYSVTDGTAGTPPREFGLALLSRYPVVAFRNHPLTRLSTQGVNATPTLMPGFLEVTVDLGGTPVRIFDTHLDYRADPAVRIRQVAEMLALIGAGGGEEPPTLLLGDLNAPPGAPELAPLFRRLQDAWTATPPAHGAGTAIHDGFTYPSAAPLKRIDYVLVSPGIRVRTVRVVGSAASDHRAVVADLLVPALRR